MYLGNKLTKKEIQDYVRTNSGGLLYEPYHKGEFRIKMLLKNMLGMIPKQSLI